MSDDVLAEFEPLVDAAEARDAEVLDADLSASPWLRGDDGSLRYEPNTALLVDLLSGPISQGAKTQSGRLAKAFDVWMAYELRRARFHEAEVWPRNRSPRVSSTDLEDLTKRVEKLLAWVDKNDEKADRAAKRLEDAGDADAIERAEARLVKKQQRDARAHAKRLESHAKKVAKATAAGKEPPLPPEEPGPTDRVADEHELMPGLRAAIKGVARAMPNVNATNVLGRFYVKQVDVVVSSWDRGPDVLISGKTMFSSFAKNTKNRYEETLGEATNLRDRYPLAAMGYAFLVSDKIFNESGAYGRLQDLLLRTRKPHGPYDATMLLIAAWDETTQHLNLFNQLNHPDPAASMQQPPVDLGAARFFTDLLNSVIVNTPLGIHEDVRVLRNGTSVPGGKVDPTVDDSDADN